jgi:hypothetical protein
MKSIACCLIASISLSWIYCRSLLESLDLDLNMDFFKDSRDLGSDLDQRTKE